MAAPPLRQSAEELAARLLALVVAAERVAMTVAQGVHGRRRVGQGEAFWQFRQYQPGDAAARVDWRESAKSQRLYVRETEWEAAQSVWLWRDASASMDYTSSRYFPAGDWPTKRDRAELILVALASLLVRGGERLTLLGSGIAPMTGRAALTRLVEMIENRPGGGKAAPGLPVFEPLPRAGQLVLVADFLAPLERVQAAVAQFAGAGLKGHLLQIADPAEEDLPFAGRVRFEGVEEPDDRQTAMGRVGAHERHPIHVHHGRLTVVAGDDPRVEAARAETAGEQSLLHLHAAGVAFGVRTHERVEIGRVEAHAPAPARACVRGASAHATLQRSSWSSSCGRTRSHA